MKKIKAAFAMAISISATPLLIVQANAQTPNAMPEVSEAPAVPNPKLPKIAAVVYEIGDAANPTKVQCGVDRDNFKTTIPGESITIVTKLTNGMYYVDIDSIERGDSKALVDGKRVITADEKDPTKIVEKRGQDATTFINLVEEGKTFCSTYMTRYVLRYNQQIHGGIRADMGFKSGSGNAYHLMTFIPEAASMSPSTPAPAPTQVQSASGPGGTR